MRFGPAQANLYLSNANGSGEHRLTKSDSLNYDPSWSPKGEWIVFTSSRMGFKDEALLVDTPNAYGEIFVMRYDGTHVEPLTDDKWEEGAPCWQHEKPARVAGAMRSH